MGVDARPSRVAPLSIQRLISKNASELACSGLPPTCRISLVSSLPR
jgi:hypothetical protein